MAVWGVLLTAALAPLPARAQRSDSEQAALLREGERLYEAGRYLEAAELLEAANDYAPDPRLVYNIARAYDQAGELRRALAYYQRYLKLRSGTDPILVKRAELSVDRLGTLLEREAAQLAERTRLRAEQEAERKRVEEESEARRAEAEEQRRRAQVAAEQSRFWLKRSAALAFAVTSLTGAGVGAYFGVKARGARKDFEMAATVEDKRALASRTRRQALLADVGFTAAVASAVAALLFYPREGAPAGIAHFAPPPAGVGAGVEVSF